MKKSTGISPQVSSILLAICLKLIISSPIYATYPGDLKMPELSCFVMQEALKAAESERAAQQVARADADNKWRVAVAELEKTRAELAAYQKTAEAEKAALTKRADNAESRLTSVSDELQSLKNHISRMTSAIFGKY